jgi:type II secretory ATPase GspE/PulE/Tfp pilus assembly ATPase PilB-like protein
MVGEVRDGETAAAATQAALTGHLVLSSIHANDAAGALYRLAHLGVERFLLVSAVIGAVSQRLVRKVCPHCKTTVSASEAEEKAYHAAMGEKLGEYACGQGCYYCGQTGYLGRTGVFEFLIATAPVREMFSQGASAFELRAEAAKSGMTSMQIDGMQKVKAGVTTPSEVMRNVYAID